MANKRYVEFFLRKKSEGKVFNMNTFRELQNIEIAENSVKKEDLPEGCLGYRFFSMNIFHERYNHSPCVFFGEVITLAEASIDEKNWMNERDIQRAVRLKTGGLEIYYPWDSVINM